ncbi:AaceriAER258Cp [[Ashbya] aceris (nom. inval.)]|nr:AaceriAER258Cp [[Ashbya] aceris (nom. inval.)]
MGQRVSSDATETTSSIWTFAARDELVAFFNARAIRQLSAVELWAFRQNIGKNVEPTEELDIQALAHIYGVPADVPWFTEIFYPFMCRLTSFPLMHDTSPPTYMGVLKACLLFSKKRAARYTSRKSYDLSNLVWALLAPPKDVCYDNEELFDGNKLIDTLDNTVVTELEVPAIKVLHLFTFMLQLLQHCDGSNTVLDPSIFTEWEQHEQNALCLVRSLNSAIVGRSDARSHSITYERFTAGLRHIFPNIFNALSLFLERLFYIKRDTTNKLLNISANESSTIVTNPLLAQLATVYPRINLFTNMQRLFVAGDAGFSMSAFQAKVFKWMAPTILFVSGTRINDDATVCTKNKRYKTFLQDYPALKDTEQRLALCDRKKRHLVYAVFVKDPWKLTNKDLFGDMETTVIQLAPRQKIFKAQEAPNIYFNAVGGGIGFGSPQPNIKPTGKKYYPGNVSLTIEPSMEFAVFRNLGEGGMFSHGSATSPPAEQPPSYELRFMVKDLEVWGYGGEEELQKQIQRWQWEEAEATRRKYIKTNGGKEDRALLEMAGIIGHYQSGGSV